MHYTDPVYRPPFEASSLLIEVTTGCSHNKCRFCTMYKEVPFCVAPMSQIEEDILEAAKYYSYMERVFLVNADPFVLSAKKLKEITDLIHKHLPKVQSIGMYATILNIGGKSDNELLELRKAGINQLNIGVESGNEKAIRYFNKGYDLETAKTQLKRLKKAGIDYSINIILGALGEGHWEENAIANAAFLNEVQPYLIFTGTLHIDKGSRLEKDYMDGEYIEATIGEILQEEIEMTKRLELDDCIFFGLHPSNVVVASAYLPEQKGELVSYMEKQYLNMSEEKKKMRPTRGSEGGIIS